METSSTRSSSRSSFGQLLDVLGVLVLSQHPDLLWARSQPIAGPRAAKIGAVPDPSAPRPRPRRCGAHPLGDDAAPGRASRSPRTRRRRRSTTGRSCSAAARSASSGFRPAPGTSWTGGGRVLRSAGAPLPRMLARRLVSAGAFVPQPRERRLGPDDVTVVVPVRDRPGAARTPARAHSGRWRASWSTTRRPTRGATKEIAERHGARFVGLATNVGPAGARNAGLAVVGQPDRRLRRLRLRAVGGVARAAARPLRRPAGRRGGPAHRPRRTAGPAGALSRYEAARSSLDRGPDAGPVRPGSPIPFVPSAAILVRADVADGPDLFDPALRGGEDVDLVWRLGQAGWDVRYVPSSTVQHDGPRPLGAFLAPPGLLRHDRRAAGAGATGTRLAPLHLSRAGRWRSGCWRWPAARSWRWAALAASRRHPGPPSRRSRPGPRGGGDAHRRGWARRARPCRHWPTWSRAWSPGPAARAGLPPDPAGSCAGAAPPRGRRTGGRAPRGARPGALRRPPRRRRRRVRGRGLGGLRAGAHRSCRWSPA